VNFGDRMGLMNNPRVKAAIAFSQGFKCWNHGGRGGTIGSLTFPAAKFPRMGGDRGASFEEEGAVSLVDRTFRLVQRGRGERTFHSVMVGTTRNSMQQSAKYQEVHAS
jgi:hypothetical protein